MPTGRVINFKTENHLICKLAEFAVEIVRLKREIARLKEEKTRLAIEPFAFQLKK
ncbi:MAG: hypothetical protein M3367_03285 [Acidobacteriota bacterium]|nr:hypothetical protein [Acidobacteriota bacterium]